jgi:hypothetical protein
MSSARWSCAGIFSEQGSQVSAQVGIGEAAGQQAEDAQGPAGRGALDGDGQLGDRSAFPPQDQAGAAGVLVTVHGDVHLLQQGAQQLLAVLIGGGSVPDGLKVIAEGQDGGALGGGERGGPGGLAAGELGLGGGQLGERFFPGGFQAAGDQPAVRVDRLVAALGLCGLVAGLLDLAAPLLKRGVVALLELPGGSRQACSATGSSAARNALVTAWSMATPPTRRCRVPGPSTMFPVPVQ